MIPTDKTSIRVKRMNMNETLIALSRAYVAAQLEEHREILMRGLERCIDPPMIIIDEDEK